MAASGRKRKFEEEEENNREKIFDIFHKNFSKMETLCEAYSSICSKKACFIKVLTINRCNCMVSSSFSEVFCQVKEHREELYPLGMLFTSGLNIIRNFLQEKKVPFNKWERSVLATLLTYLIDEEDCQQVQGNLEEFTESLLTVILVNHLFLKLTPESQCILDKQIIRKASKHPDNCNIPDHISWGDTSIGHKNVWHGSVDAIVGGPRGTVALVNMEKESESPGVQTCVEEEQNCVDVDLPHPQIVAETIVFSFLQKHLNPHFTNSLIPTIGISASEVVIYLYDSEHDILLQTVGFPFKEEGYPRMLAILVCWLTINYGCLCDGLTGKLIEAPKANFFEQAEETIEIYRRKLQYEDVGNVTNKTVTVFESLLKYGDSNFEIPPHLQAISAIILPDDKSKLAVP